VYCPPGPESCFYREGLAAGPTTNVGNLLTGHWCGTFYGHVMSTTQEPSKHGIVELCGLAVLLSHAFLLQSAEDHIENVFLLALIFVQHRKAAAHRETVVQIVGIVS